MPQAHTAARLMTQQVGGPMQKPPLPTERPKPEDRLKQVYKASLTKYGVEAEGHPDLPQLLKEQVTLGTIKHEAFFKCSEKQDDELSVAGDKISL